VISTGIQVRPIRIRDLLRLRSMRTDASVPDYPHGPFGDGLADPWSAIPVSRRARRSFVGFLDGRPVGLVDLISDPSNHRWVLSRILTCQQLPDGEFTQWREDIWRELVIQAIRGAGTARAKRIHAVLEDGSPVLQAMRSAGFAEYAQDTVLVTFSLPDHGPAGIVRRQDPSDVWAVHQLYHQVTPRPVQYAEALTSNFWSRFVPGQPAARSYVVEDGMEIVGHCRVTQGCNGPILHAVVHPESLQTLTPLIRDVVHDLGPQGKHPMAVVVPDYLQEYIDPLESLGFEFSGRHSRLVKYTVVTRQAQVRGVEEFAREVPERVAAGTPTLSYAPAGDSERSCRGRHDNQKRTEIS
jgi:hypothetical protein